MYKNDATVFKPGATSMNVSIHLKNLKGDNMVILSTGIAKILQTDQIEINEKT